MKASEKLRKHAKEIVQSGFEVQYTNVVWILDLADEVKELEEKALKYDELSE